MNSFKLISFPSTCRKKETQIGWLRLPSVDDEFHGVACPRRPCEEVESDGRGGEMHLADAVGFKKQNDLPIRGHGEAGEVGWTGQDIQGDLGDEIHEIEVAEHVHESENAVPENVYSKPRI